MTVYTLKKRGDTGEHHLFCAEMVPGKNECTPAAKSICKKMDKSESAGNSFSCQSESLARIKCAEQGRSVCGTCVSYLYTTY